MSILAVYASSCSWLLATRVARARALSCLVAAGGHTLLGALVDEST